MDVQRIKEAIVAPAPAPLHVKLRQAIYEQIVDGVLAPGERLPSERKMRAHFGVSRATIRQAIGALVQEGVLQSIAGTGTFVLEPKPREAVTTMVGLLTSHPHFNNAYPRLMSVFTERVRRAGYGLSMALHGEQAAEFGVVIDTLLNQNIVGLVVVPPRFGNASAVLDDLRRRDIPTIFLTRPGPDIRFDCVAVDNRQIGYRAARHLIELGHRYIVHIGQPDYSTGQERAAGYRQAMVEANLQPQIVSIKEDPARTRARASDTPPLEHLIYPSAQLARELWGAQAKDPSPTAVFCFNDIVAMSVYKELRDLSLSIPGDVSLVSVDDLLAVRHFEVPLTTFRLPGSAIGAKSAELLLQRLEGDHSPPARIFLPATFIERASTAPPV